jgi:thioredoxin reductase (NADPH)
MILSTDLLQRLAFPVLDQAQLNSLRAFGYERTTRAGEVLFRASDAIYPLVVVLDGRTRIIDCSDGTTQVIEDSGPGEMHGELAMLTGQQAFADCVVSEPGTVLLVPPTGLRDAIHTSPKLSDLLVMAFLARRQVLMRLAAASLTIIATKPSPTPLQLKEFLVAAEFHTAFSSGATRRRPC